MAHTYGEVLERSYEQIFEYIDVKGATGAILDIGSGYGGVLFAAVQRHGCLALGIGALNPPPPPPPRGLVLLLWIACKLFPPAH